MRQIRTLFQDEINMTKNDLNTKLLTTVVIAMICGFRFDIALAENRIGGVSLDVKFKNIINKNTSLKGQMNTFVGTIKDSTSSGQLILKTDVDQIKNTLSGGAKTPRYQLGLLYPVVLAQIPTSS